MGQKQSTIPDPAGGIPQVQLSPSEIKQAWENLANAEGATVTCTQESIMVCFDNYTFCCSSEGKVSAFSDSNFVTKGQEVKDVRPPFQFLSLRNITSICASHKDIFMLDSDKVVWEFHNWNNTKLRERKVKNIPEIRSIFCGPQSAFFVTTDSKVWCSGANGFGNLGLGDFNEREFPQLLEFPNPVDKIACGDSHTIILCEDSSIWVSGRNNQGQLGIIVQGGTVTKQHCTPIFIQAVPRSKIISVSCGSGHSIFLREDGVVLGCGSNSRRQLVCSDGTKRFPTIVEIPLKESVEFIFANNKRSFYIDTEGKLFYCGNNHQTICRITFPSGEPEPYFAAVTQGKDDSYIVARDLDGTLWSIRSPLHRSRLPISLNYSVPIRLPEELSSICGFRRSPKKSARK